MSLVIILIKAPGSIDEAASSMSLDKQGATLGRGEENNWVLDDPELYLSSLHCEFSFENEQYYITDRSTNGTFYNGSVDPIGKGSKLPVNKGDRFIIGDYEFSISDQEPSARKESANNPFSDPGEGLPSSIPGDRLFASDESLGSFTGSPFDGEQVSSNNPLFSSGTVDSDPLAALDKARGGSMPLTAEPIPVVADDLFSSSTQSDGANPLNQQLEWPEPIPSINNTPENVIPDDWDIDVEEPAEVAPVTPVAPKVSPPVGGPSARERALEIVNQKLLAENETLKLQRDSQQVESEGSGNVDTTFINALGFAQQNLSGTEIDQINRVAGKVMREMISGMMQVLGSRSSIKNEFRMNVTTIQPVENNPLKFSANVDDALENMFLKEGNAFKQPLDSVRDGFEGIAEHQIAIIAGIREAFRTVIDRFDPITLEERFGKQGSGGILPGSQKAKNWEAYIHYYDELAGDIDRSFQYLFGDGFVRAYEDQLQKLAVAKKSRLKEQDTRSIDKGEK